MYPESAVERVLVVQRALRIGFTLGELAEVLKMRDAGGAPCRRVYEMASEKLKGVRTSIQDLRRMEKYLKMVLSDWEGRVRHAAPGQRLHLLQSLSPAIKRSGEKTSRFARRQKS
jgi:DNA-binding transcriptional MerR regulator